MWYRRRGPWPSWPRWALIILILNQHLTSALRCYVCGGVTGRPCEPIRPPGRRSPYIRPSPVPASDGSAQWQTCDDIISNRGCIKQVVNDVVLLRACWMQGTDKCEEDGEAEVCTCTQDLCNLGRRNRPTLVLTMTLIVTLTLMWWSQRT